MMGMATLRRACAVAAALCAIAQGGGVPGNAIANAYAEEPGGLAMTGAVPLAANAVTVGEFTVSGGTQGTDFSLSGGVLTVNDGANLTISTSAQTTNRIAIAEGATATIILGGVNIATPDAASDTLCPLDLGSGARLTLVLADGTQNTFKAGDSTDGNGALGIHVPNNAQLTVQGDGSLAVTGGSSMNGYGGAGIGGLALYLIEVHGESSGTVVILADTVSVTGGNSEKLIGGAGIGGGAGAYSSELHGKVGTGGDARTTIVLGKQVTLTGGTGGDLGYQPSAGNAIGGGGGWSYGGGGTGIRPTSTPGLFEVCGELTLPCDITIPNDVTVDIPVDETQTMSMIIVPEGITLTNNGVITGDGVLWCQDGGTIDGSGTKAERVKSYPWHDDWINLYEDSVKADGKIISKPYTAPYGSKVDIDLGSFSTGSQQFRFFGSVSLYQGEREGGKLLATGKINSMGYIDVLPFTVEGKEWVPREKPYEMTIVMTGTHGMTASTLTFELKVEKADSALTASVEGSELTYGDKLTVNGKVGRKDNKALSIPEGMDAGSVALYCGDVQLGEPVAVKDDGTYTITYDTAKQGIKATGESQQLTVKYTGDLLEDAETAVSVSLDKAPLDGKLAVSGEGAVGEELAVAYTPVGDEVVSLQWLRDGEPIDGATGETYLLTDADAGTEVSVRATATDDNHTGSVTSVAVAVAELEPPAPEPEPGDNGQPVNPGGGTAGDSGSGQSGNGDGAPSGDELPATGDVSFSVAALLAVLGTGSTAVGYRLRRARR